jgi:uncharacterized protein (TIGR00730 family)
MKIPLSACVYCGSSSRVAETYKAAAHELGETLAKCGVTLVYGGGRVGLMGVAADAALAAGGKVVGIIPEHLQTLEVGHAKLTELHVVESMHARKRMMVDRSDGFVILPGGLGTMDEFFEIVTWKQLRLHGKPVVLVNIDGYWDPLLALYDHMISQGFCQATCRDLIRVVENVDEVMAALSANGDTALPVESKWL